MKKTGISKYLPALSKDNKGIAAVEFALVAPFIIVLMLASVDAVFALTAKRKVAVATHAIADLSARAQNLSDADLEAIAGLGRLIMTPFDVSQSRIAITGVEVLPSGTQGVVRWSHLFESPGSEGTTSNGTGLTTEYNVDELKGFSAALTPGTFVVYSAVELPYSTFFQFLERRFNGANMFILGEDAYFQSRSGEEITNN